eukprot:GDKI01033418.1.p1 GENE.GDKI01033418.1~~GDKI01033418.1.p1  ORF type:complete len:386 (+),score=97.28 GDKI01033418.1:170-1327(+)
MAQSWHGERYNWWQNMKKYTPPVYVCPPINPHHPPDKEGDIATYGRPDTGLAWAHVPWTQDFVDIEGPLLKGAPRFNTRVKMMWDPSQQCVWVGTYMQEPHLYATLTERNSIIFRDDSDFEIFINPSGSTHSYYEYEVNALNTVWELHLTKPYSDNGQATHGTNLPHLTSHVWLDGALNRTDGVPSDKGWALVVKVPVGDLRDLVGAPELPPHTPKGGDYWRINFSRVQWQTEVRDGKLQKVIGPVEDNWVWSPQGIINMHRPEKWGFLLFSDGKDGLLPGQNTTPIPDPRFAVKELLLEVCHYMCDYHAHFKRYAHTCEELGISAGRIGEAGVTELTLSAPDPTAKDEREREPFGFVAKARVTISGGRERVVCARGDSLLWVAE